MKNTDASNDPAPKGNGAAREEKPAEEPRADATSSKPSEERSAEADRAFLAKVAVYSGEMSAGLGIKALNRELLAAQLDDPVFRNALKDRVIHGVEQSLSDVEVSYGVDAEVIAEAADAFVEAIKQGSDETVTRKVAQGDAPEPGEDGRLEYPLNPDNLPMN